MDNIIEVKKLSKIYADGNSKVTALDNVNLTIKKGDDLVIIGPSGSGKTTLLQLISGMSSPTSGSVLIDGRDINKGKDKDISFFRNKTIGFVFQMIYLQDYLTAEENVMVPMLVAKKNRTESLKKAQELLERVGLKERMKHKPNQLSGGEMQRVAIARALANDPKLIMADEPTGKLDKKNADIIMDVLADVSSNGVSLIIITHDEKIAKRFQHSVKLEHGQIIS